LELEGLSGSIYTQPYDVEGEENGLMTYDREYIKIPLAKVRQINNELVPTAKNIPADIVINDNNKNDEAQKYADLLRCYVHGRADTSFLKELAMLARKQGDRVGGQAVADSYIKVLKPPFSNEQINFITNFTHSSNDYGFSVIQKNRAQFADIIGERKLLTDQMNMIYHGIVEPEMAINAQPDWQLIKEKIQPFGNIGEQTFLRARTFDALNRRDWRNFIPFAEEYLSKYGVNIDHDEKVVLEQNIDAHSN
jgi:hypothetical protein